MNSQIVKKKYIIKIPKSIFLCYLEQNRILFLKGPLGHRIINLKLKLKTNKKKGFMFVTDQFFHNVSINDKKNLKAYQGTYTSLIKKKIFELLKPNFKKLKLVGVGYKVLLEKKNALTLLKLSLGFSHDIYFKLPNDIQITCYKNNKLIILGNNFKKVSLIASIIRSYKIPEVYKGKGILYENEQIKLKEGKKV